MRLCQLTRKIYWEHSFCILLEALKASHFKYCNESIPLMMNDSVRPAGYQKLPEFGLSDYGF